MKDYLGTAKWINLFPRNPTQTDHIRFMVNPASPLKSGFTKSREEWDKAMRGALQTGILKQAGWYDGGRHD
jgi:hypothetical protein